MDDISQTIWPLSQNLLHILENTTSSHIYQFFSKIWSCFSERTVSIYLYWKVNMGQKVRLHSFDQKSEFAKKCWKTKLRNTMWSRLMKILWKDDMEPLSFVSLLQYSYRRERFKGCYGSREDNTIHSVQKVNSVLFKNMG